MSRVEALADVYAEISSVVGGLDEADFNRPTGCDAWSVQDLLFHLLLDAQRALITLADPSNEATDTDAVSYWERRPWDANGVDDIAHIRFVRRSALAYAAPMGLVAQWRDTATAAVSAARRADPSATVSTQACRLSADDFIDTLVVEATLHYLDLAVALPGGSSPPATALRLTRRTLEGLLGHPAPDRWTDAEVARGLTGRRALDAGERSELGKAVAQLPLIR